MGGPILHRSPESLDQSATASAKDWWPISRAEMGNAEMDERLVSLHTHLASWGLRRFRDENSYYRWQRDQVSSEDLHTLNQLLSERRTSVEAEIAFYDHAAHQEILPALHSQQYDYYLTVGSAIIDRIPPARRVLDFGCGVGILTTYYASIFPDIEFVGIDRSSGSIATASAEARRRGLRNIRFEMFDVPAQLPRDRFDLILSTHAVFQAEQEPGLPSLTWKTFARGVDEKFQEFLEERTGLKVRLDALCHRLDSRGRLLLCEKAEHLGRRIFLQRALSARGFTLCAKPLPLRYFSLGEMVDDGPVYEVRREPQSCWAWNEQIEWREGQSLYTVSGSRAHQIGRYFCQRHSHRTMTVKTGRFGLCRFTLGQWGKALCFCYMTSEKDVGGVILSSQEDASLLTQLCVQWETRAEAERERLISTLWGQENSSSAARVLPWYENHTPAAQFVWEALPDKVIRQEATFDGEEGRQMHLEIGNSRDLAYLYWANTFDQRQLVIMSVDDAAMLHQYFAESVAEAHRSTSERKRD